MTKTPHHDDNGLTLRRWMGWFRSKYDVFQWLQKAHSITTHGSALSQYRPGSPWAEVHPYIRITFHTKSPDGTRTKVGSPGVTLPPRQALIDVLKATGHDPSVLNLPPEDLLSEYPSPEELAEGDRIDRSPPSKVCIPLLREGLSFEELVKTRVPPEGLQMNLSDARPPVTAISILTEEKLDLETTIDRLEGECNDLQMRLSTLHTRHEAVRQALMILTAAEN